ncbi:MAG: ABC transporter permease [Proteobacteria bacterium]|nr:ABC transporter permease [Pseudomonadota bacterium]
MLKNILLLTVRNLLANRLFSLINVLGLTVGLVCVILIALFVRHESSYDKHWVNADRTYKVMRTFLANSGSPSLHLAANAPQVGPLLRQDFPEFQQVVRIMSAGQLVLTDPESNQSYYEEGFQFVDPEIYQVFDIPLIYGDWESALQAPLQMVVSESLARKYFGDQNPVGETIIVANQAPVRITGVMQDPAGNSHLNARGFISLSTTTAMFGDSFLENWASNNFHTYFVAPDGYNIESFIDSLPDFINRHVGENATDFTQFEVIALTDIHLHSQRDGELQVNGNVVTVYTFSAIAVFILLIACFNFMNLSTARSASRAREVGLRKTLGADQWQIIAQFLGESIALTVIAMALAMGSVELLLPWFNNLIGLDLAIDYTKNPQVILLLGGLALVVGLLAGSYPAFYLSSFPSVNSLKGELTRGSAGVKFRKILVVLQFSISITLVVASGIAIAQLNYAMKLDPGFTKEQVLLYRGAALEGVGSNYQTMKQELLRHPEILSVTAANLMPGDQNTNSIAVRYEGGTGNFIGLPFLNVDYDFFETFDIEIISGRSFSEDRATDLFVEPTEEYPNTRGAFVLNEMAARQIGFSPDEALNKWFEVGRGREIPMAVRGPIIGVADNIYFSSIREAVKPVFYRVMEHDNSESQFPNFRQVAVKISGRNLDETLSFIESTWNSFLPNVPFRQTFLEQKIQALYQAEQRQSDLFRVFSIMAIFIAGLGLFGLASYLTEQRTKEIAIRKVLGSTVFGIVTLLTKDFTKLVLLANIIAWPAAWYFMNAWLEKFAYRTPIEIGIFIFAALLAWLIALITVGTLAAITANINPTLSLRHE